ncbi:MAG: deoxyribonuclease V [Chloroflexota bacterium]
MRYRELHGWDVDAAEAIAIQQRLRSQVVTAGEPGEVRLVVGVDMGLRGERMHAAAVALDYPGLVVVAQSTAERPPTFPYVPGLLSFREAPAILAALAGLQVEPDLVFVDGQGIAHPRRLGIAAHLGLLLERPTIGVAKSILVGKHEAVGPEVGARAPLVANGEVVGYALRTRVGVKPLYISVGHRLSLEAAVDWVLRCGRGYRLPEPTRRAHQLASAK